MNNEHRISYRGEVNLFFLLQQLQQGSEPAFAKIYDQFSRQLYRNILRMVNDEDIAQEILQDLFLTVWVKRAKLDPNKSFTPFLYKVAKDMIYDHYRKVANNKRIIDHLIITTVDHVTNAEDSIIDREMYDLLMRAIEHLPAQRKQVFKLCKFEGKSYQEVGEILGISPNTIRNQIVAANKSVKEYFLLNHDVAILFIVTSLAHLL
ncbi:RNA polymerase sigma-70 factor, ECF subfamily [Mucilaginibacter pineti]|uniref:RNA polymerase sigma-70 factor, ECF subfamily n=1 Tax=Mucilaginibacter pineti TaxID=1391627 RepID=A0A1G7L991_9SPHI|nr:sigma-70 family RNA polymerase sigma factor [Mucilaginibacter pineti]SDF45589.1 RNA polymerase sigma-70 factor, ECF subfamily [Mucilaginibacter pineti]